MLNIQGGDMSMNLFSNTVWESFAEVMILIADNLLQSLKESIELIFLIIFFLYQNIFVLYYR